jgi:flagellar protein FlaG
MNVTSTTRPAPPAPAGNATEPAPRNNAAAGNSLPVPGKPAPAKVPVSPPVSIEKAIEQIQAYLKDSKRQLAFERDASTERTVIKVIDAASGEVIRQFPSEEVLKIAAIIDTQGFRSFDELA